jgi:hypothetical protein
LEVEVNTAHIDLVTSETTLSLSLSLSLSLPFIPFLLLHLHIYIPPTHSASYFFKDLADANSASSSAIIYRSVLDAATYAPGISPSAVVSYCVGTQMVSKFKESDNALNTVKIYLCNIRLPEAGR